MYVFPFYSQTLTLAVLNGRFDIYICLCVKSRPSKCHESKSKLLKKSAILAAAGTDELDDLQSPGVDFLLIPDARRRQNLIAASLAHGHPSHKVSPQSVCTFRREPAHRPRSPDGDAWEQVAGKRSTTAFLPFRKSYSSSHSMSY